VAKQNQSPLKSRAISEAIRNRIPVLRRTVIPHHQGMTSAFTLFPGDGDSTKRWTSVRN